MTRLRTWDQGRRVQSWAKMAPASRNDAMPPDGAAIGVEASHADERGVRPPVVLTTRPDT